MAILVGMAIGMARLLVILLGTAIGMARLLAVLPGAAIAKIAMAIWITCLLEMLHEKIKKKDERKNITIYYYTY